MHVLMGVIKKIKEFTCTKFNIDQFLICPQATQTRVSFPASHTVVNEVFDFVHMDVWGPYKLSTYNGMKYFLTLVDDKSRWTWTFLLASKSDAIVVLDNFC